MAAPRLARDPHDHVAIALAGSALCLEPFDHVRRQPDVTLAALVDVILIVDAAERQGRGYRVECGFGDGDAEQAAVWLKSMGRARSPTARRATAARGAAAAVR